jgi:hypothetical protein
MIRYISATLILISSLAGGSIKASELKWLYTKYYPWVYSASDKTWMISENGVINFSRYPEMTAIRLGGETVGDNFELTDGMLWTLTYDVGGQTKVTSVEYNANFEDLGEVLLVQQPLFDTADNGGIILLDHIQNFQLQDGSLLLSGGTLSNFAATLKFKLTGENSGIFEAVDLSVGVTRAGNFQTEILSPEARTTRSN